MKQVQLRRFVGWFYALLFFIAVFLPPVTASAASQVVPLRPEKAFVLDVKIIDSHTVNAIWHIAPDYFLYTNKLSFASTSSDVTLDPKMPDSTGLRDSPDGGIEPVYSGNLVIPIKLLADGKAPTDFSIVVSYQGCAADGFCYPPMKKQVAINMQTKQVTYQHVDVRGKKSLSISELFTDHNKIKHIFSTEHFGLTLLMFLLLGVLLAFTPCVLPMLPILTGIIIGERKIVSTQRAFFLSFTYVLGVAVAYALAGVIATLMGGSIQVWMQKPLFVIALALFLVLLALSLFEFFDLPISRRWQNLVMRWSARHQGGTYVGVFFMGIFSTLIVSPCVTAPMIGVLLYIAQTGNLLFGASALFVMGLGMGIPLIIVGMSAGKFLPKSGPWMAVIVKMFGLVLLGMAIWLVSRLMLPAVSVFVWGLYFIGMAAFMYMIMPDLIKHKLVNRGLGMLAAAVGVALMLNAVGMVPVLDEWTGLTASVADRAFITVHSRSQLQDEIAKANREGRPVLVDFYADWCEACISMDRKVFDRESVQQLLQRFVLVRVDLTENSSEDQALMQQYDVIAPPTILLFTVHGKEVASKRIIGELGADEFTQRINLFIAKHCDQQVQC